MMNKERALIKQEVWNSKTQKSEIRFTVAIRNPFPLNFLFGKWTYNPRIYFLNKSRGISYFKDNNYIYIEINEVVGDEI